MVKVSSLLQKGLIVLLQAYIYLIDPVLGKACRFYPSCSKYALIAIKEYGSCVGLLIMAKRLIRCHPWHPGGFDPVKKTLKPPEE